MDEPAATPVDDLDTSSPEAPGADRRAHWRLDRVRLLRAAGAVMATVAVAAVVLAAGTAFYYRRAGDASLSLRQRADAADVAVRMMPWVPAVRARQGYLRSRQLYAQGEYLGAVDVMQAAYADAVGDPELLAWFRKVQDALATETNRKAHLQHGHEGPGGTLRPQDIER